MTQTIRSGVLALALGLAGTAAQAAPITFAYAGEILFGFADPVYGFSPDPVAGTPFSGTYTFDSTAADANGAPDVGSYSGLALTFTLAGQIFAYGSGVTVSLTDGFSSFGFGHDQYLVGAADIDTVLSIRLTDFSDALFNGDALPLTPFPLAGLFTELFFQDAMQSGQLDLNGRITSFTCIAGCDDPPVIPEPTTILLLSSGLAAAALRRRVP